MAGRQENRFHFIPFSERIASISVNPFHRLTHRNEDDTQEETYMQQACDKWIAQNRAKDWVEFHKEVSPYTKSLALILHNKDRIAQSFLKAIPRQTDISIQPVLEVLAAFVKDLQLEFYGYFSPILASLINLLRTKNPNLIEWTFVCLAIIFKYLAPKLVRDLGSVMLIVAPLFHDSQPEYIRNFAGESFAFVARKVKDYKKLLFLILDIVQGKVQLLQGCGKLLGAMMHNIKGMPHSTSTELLTTIFVNYYNPAVPVKILHALATVVVGEYLKQINPTTSQIFGILLDVVLKGVQLGAISSVAFPLKLIIIILQQRKHVTREHLTKLIQIITVIATTTGKAVTILTPILIQICKLILTFSLWLTVVMVVQINNLVRILCSNLTVTTSKL